MQTFVVLGGGRKAGCQVDFRVVNLVYKCRASQKGVREKGNQEVERMQTPEQIEEH